MFDLGDSGELASGSVRSTLARRYSTRTFSRDLWRAMGESGLFGLTVAREAGGSGGTAASLGSALRLFARGGCDAGLSLSWITHHALCMKSIELLGNKRQQAEYLPRLISGEWVGAAAVSEPGSGARAAGMRTDVRQSGRSFVLNGRKVLSTCGTVADLLLVVAVSGTSPGGRKELTAFLVETPTAGLNAQTMELDFLKTAPHAELLFEDVVLPGDRVLGGVGQWNAGAGLSAFARERAMVASMWVGVLEAAAGEVAARIASSGGAFESDPELARDWVERMACLEAFDLAAKELMDAAFAGPESWRERIGLWVFIGTAFRSWGSWLADVVAARGVEVSFPLDILLNDMRLATVGDRTLYREGRRRYIEGIPGVACHDGESREQHVEGPPGEVAGEEQDKGQRR